MPDASSTSDGPPDHPAPAVAARTLRELLGHPGALMAMRLAGGQLRRLHEQPLPPAAGCTTRGPRDEASALTADLERVIWQAPSAYAAVGERGRVVIEDLGELRTPPRRVIHGHLDLEQILLTDDGEAIIALPAGVTLGDPVIDLACLAAHLAAAVDPATAKVLRRALLVGYNAPARWGRRLAIYEQAMALRLICVDALLMCAAAPPAARRPREGRARMRPMPPRLRGRVPALR